MATTTLSSSILSLSPSCSLGLRRTHNPSLSSSLSLIRTNPSFKILRQLRTNNNNKLLVVSFSSSSSSSDHLSSDKDDNFTSKKSVLLNLIQAIEPLDVSSIQKDVPPTTLDAMKRTISGMLGLLPSDRFQVLIEALWEPLSKLLVSSMMTGYTLRNAEYRLSLEKNFELNEGSTETLLTAKLEGPRRSNTLSGEDEMISGSSDHMSETIGAQDLGEITPEAQQYILKLKSSLSSVQKELREVKRKSAALQMQKFVGEEKNDLLDYLRSLQPEKVAELSEPTCPELKEAIYSVIHGLLATLSTKMHSRAPMSENTPNGSVNVETEEDHFDVIENASLPYQPLISLTRDYLARLLFWCMLLGHYLRGLEYRMELTELLSLPINLENYPLDDELAV